MAQWGMNLVGSITHSNALMVQAALETVADSQAGSGRIGQVLWKEDGALVDNVTITTDDGDFHFVARNAGSVLRQPGSERSNSCYVLSLAAAMCPASSDSDLNELGCKIYFELRDAVRAAEADIGALPWGSWKSFLGQTGHDVFDTHLLSAFLPMLFPTKTLQERAIVLFRVQPGERSFDRIVIMRPAGGKSYVGEPLCILVDEERDHAHALVGEAGRAKVLLDNYLRPWASLDPILVRNYEMTGWRSVDKSQFEHLNLRRLQEGGGCVSCGKLVFSP
jgi:hypothetical protein